jgi:hypothetical protein
MESKSQKFQKTKSEIFNLSNRTIPVQCDKIVINTSSGQYQKALEEIQQIRNNLNVLEENLNNMLSFDN